MSVRHVLKSDPVPFEQVFLGYKTHEIRLNDRDYQTGDVLRIRETRYSAHQMQTEDKPLEYTGRVAMRTVSHVQTGYGLQVGWCILSFRPFLDTNERAALEGLLELALATYHACDNTEERCAGAEPSEHVMPADDFARMAERLDALAALPDDKPGYTLGEAAKARWALRRIIGEGV